MRSSLAAAIVGLVAATSCGAPCRDYKSALELVRDRRGPPPAGTLRPHVEVVIPHHAINRILPEVIAEMPPVELPLPPALALLGVPSIELASTRVTVEPAPAGKVAAAVDVEARFAGVPLPLGAVTIEAIPELRVERGRQLLGIRFAGDALRELSPSSAQRRLWASSYNKLPASIRDRLGRLEFVAAVELLSRHLGRAGFTLLHRHLLSRIDQVARIDVELPAMPVARAAINRAFLATGSHDAIVVELWTGLPVAAGVAPDPDARRTTTQVRMSLEAVTAVANWAILEGTMPRRYDKDLKPRADGAYFPVYGWRRGDRRPLEIHLFRDRSPCAVIVLRARPRLATEGDEIRVSVVDGTIEKVEGSAAVKVGVWASRLFKGAIEKSRAFAATTETRVGDLRFQSTVTRAELSDRHPDRRPRAQSSAENSRAKFCPSRR